MLSTLLLFLYTGIFAQENNVLTVKRLNVDTRPQASEVPSLMDSNEVEYHSIDQVNWAKFPHKPDAKFRIAHTGNAILLHYKVTESDIRAIATEDNGQVWEDSCVEFFVSPNGDSSYYNFETNCIGKLLMQSGKAPRRPLAKAEVLSKIERWSSLGQQPIEQMDGVASWELALIIPKEAFIDSPIDRFDGRVMKANFYKCGDKQKRAHYLSWNPIKTPNPNFHSYAYFGTIIFE